MVYLKGCPRCSGDLTDGQDAAGAYLACIQCGFMQDLPARVPVRALVTVPNGGVAETAQAPRRIAAGG